MIKAIGYAAKKAKASLHRIEFERGEPQHDQVQIQVLYCGVCHSDIHQVNDDWSNTVWPCLPGHEIVGRVIAKGASASKFAVGDLVGVGCMIDSCGSCTACREGEQQYCEGPKGATMTYNGPVKPDGTNTFGGYSNTVVVKESFVLRIPETLDPRVAAPILCAGVTTFSPMRRWNVGPGMRVAVVGLGGLGHVAVQLAKALGAHVDVVTGTRAKLETIHALGAHDGVFSGDKQGMKEKASSYDFMLDTIPEPHDINPLVELLKRDGTLVAVGNIGPFSKPTNNQPLVFQRKRMAGSLIGGIRETQEVLDFCAEHQVAPRVEVIPIEKINEAFKRVEKADVRYRFVIDMTSL